MPENLASEDDPRKRFHLGVGLLLGLFLLLVILWLFYESKEASQVFAESSRPTVYIQTQPNNGGITQIQSQITQTKDSLNNIIQEYQQKWLSNYLDHNSSTCLDLLPSFHAETWNGAPDRKLYNNCYAYAFRNLDLNRDHKPQPGDLAHVPNVPSHQYTCENVLANTKADHPQIFSWPLEKPCPCGTYKGYLVLDTTGPKTDYHYLREDRSGLWSQKLGSGEATQLDASGNLITNPQTANLNYGLYNYTTRCGAFCIPTDLNEVDW